MADTELFSLGPGLWSLDQAFRVGGLDLGVRTCVIRLGDGSVLVHAPGPDILAARGAIERLGPVRAVVAPNLLHHRFLRDAAGAFPGARVFAAPGLRAKLPDLPIDEDLGEKAAALWADQLDPLRVDGAPAMGEVVFLHRASRTLLCLDLCFNLRRSTSRLTRAAMRLNGAFGRFGPSRAFRHLIVKEPRALRASLDRILAWDFDRVSVAHGDVLESGGREALRQAFGWLR